MIRKFSLRVLLVASMMASWFAPVNASASHLRSDLNIVEYLAQSGRFNTLIAAVEAAGLAKTLSEGGPFTVFAPTDDAFAALPEGTVEALLADPEGALTQILLYHVIGGESYSSKLLRDDTAETLQGGTLLFKRDRWFVTVNDATIIRANRLVENGVVHIIDGVLLPPEDPTPINSLVDVLALDGRFSTLLAAVEAAGLAETLATGGPFTLFAPTDDAFAALPAGTVEALLAEPEGALRDILLYHVLGGERDAFDLVRSGSATTLQGADVSIVFDWWRVYVNGSKVLDVNMSAPNGVIHVIDGVLLPPEPEPDLVSVLEADGRFTTLLAAVEAAGLTDTLREGGPFTVFAPTDAAFAALPEGTVAALLEDPQGALTDVLLYHVVPGSRDLHSLVQEREVETLQGSDVIVYGTWFWQFVNRSWIMQPNVDASNGVAHIINRVLIPPTE